MFSTVTSPYVKRPGVTVDALENRCAPARGYTLDFVAINADMGSHSVEKFRSHAVDTPTRAPTRADRLKNRFRRFFRPDFGYDHRVPLVRCPRCAGRAWLPDYEGVLCGACGYREGDPTNEYRSRRRQRGSAQTVSDIAIERDLVMFKRIDRDDHHRASVVYPAYASAHDDDIDREVNRRVREVLRRERRALLPGKPRKPRKRSRVRFDSKAYAEVLASDWPFALAPRPAHIPPVVAWFIEVNRQEVFDAYITE